MSDEPEVPTTEPPQGPDLVRVRESDRAAVALVRGEVVTELPTDLYIPPDALEVFLETFEGPLDLLLYLIRRENLPILDIKVAEITAQYMSYIELMHAMQLELAGDYLVMAAMLAEIKSRMLLPRPVGAEEDEDDPRAELIRRLQEYEQIKSAAEDLAQLPRMERDIFPAQAEKPELVRQHAEPEVDLREVLVSLAEVLKRAEMYEKHNVQLEALSVRERMSSILSGVNEATDFVPFTDLFTAEEGRMGVVVSFLALTELIREGLLDFVQNVPFAPIYVRAAGE
ncbi:MAG: segregation/condensation protein A [Gammaproteobacteria bacterium]|nr:segregation/condensation protein A [Gammaproteobacteria bacterium]|tara:strand:- start:640 stop:1491 length:852 start_codon:yes stop_codon:yes gene_type:complete